MTTDKLSEEAIKVLDTAIELNPNDAEVWYNKGVALNELNRNAEALVVFNKAIEIKRDFADAWFHKGIALFALGRLDESHKALDKTLEITPGKSQVLEVKQKVLDKQKEFETKWGGTFRKKS